MDITATAQDRQSSTDEVRLTSVANPRRVRL